MSAGESEDVQNDEHSNHALDDFESSPCESSKPKVKTKLSLSESVSDRVPDRLTNHDSDSKSESDESHAPPVNASGAKPSDAVESADQTASGATVNHKDEQDVAPAPVQDVRLETSASPTAETTVETQEAPEASEAAEAAKETAEETSELPQQVPSEKSSTSPLPQASDATLISKDNPPVESLKSPVDSSAPSQLNPKCEVESVFIDVKREEYFNGNTMFSTLS